MDKVLVRLYVPIIEEAYEVWIPSSKKISDIIILLSKGINEIKGGFYQPEEMPILYNRDTGKMYDFEMCVQDTNIKNGTEIVMV